MNHNQMDAAIREVHAVYCTATGMQLRLGLGEYNRQAAWFRFLQAGFSNEDLHVVIRYLQRKIREGTRNVGALKFSNLVERLDAFEEELQLARAELKAMQPKATPRQRAVEQLRPTIVPMTPEQAQDTSQPIGHYLEALRRAAQ